MSEHVHGAFADLDADEVFAGLVRRTFSSQTSTVSSYRFEPGAAFPIHHHPAEQITLVLEGTLRFMVDGTPYELAAGEWSIVAGGIEHGIVAGEEGAHILAIVSPRREHLDEYELVERT